MKVFFVKFKNHPKVSTLQKIFIEQKVLRIDQRKRVNFFRIFWTIFEFVKK